MERMLKYELFFLTKDIRRLAAKKENLFKRNLNLFRDEAEETPYYITSIGWKSKTYNKRRFKVFFFGKSFFFLAPNVHRAKISYKWRNNYSLKDNLSLHLETQTSD
ncbi:hypothetical protein WA026_022926 [Henosepilachna vigintioctopunctata]|uniref:Uncharacterized protein n=1 Tax=Henosepilachna vigintioctopunctata TaxID=420089 RepID=A0AAW1TRU0_9CUCU